MEIAGNFSCGRISFCAFCSDCFELELFLLLELKQVHFDSVVTKTRMVARVRIMRPAKRRDAHGPATWDPKPFLL